MFSKQTLFNCDFLFDDLHLGTLTLEASVLVILTFLSIYVNTKPFIGDKHAKETTCRGGGGGFEN